MKNQEINQCKYEFETQEDDAENILIICKTGSGKPILANSFDTLGFADIKLSSNEILLRLAEAINSMKRGLKHVFVKIGGKFTQEEIELLKYLRPFFKKSCHYWELMTEILPRITEDVPKKLLEHSI
ncbi:15416_t:CDS:2 [Gigaspora rosea]|nr:15416_t:CDS:2 [Gigaspora rosea]